MKKHYFSEKFILKLTIVISVWCFIQLGVCESQRIQRRFMWKQMDNSMGGLMGRMFSGARVMKGMFADFLPTLSTTVGSSKLDFLPTETTRVKYIIRNPRTNKPMKIIKMRGTSKKLIKILPNPKQIGEYSSNPVTKIQFPKHNDYDSRIRLLEKEQELIAEGKLPILSDDALHDKYFQDFRKLKDNKENNNEIITGKIMEYASWKPVYRQGEQPNILPTPKPYIMSHLHTDIMVNHEMLPKPEKLIFKSNNDEADQIENELAKELQHTYEVTEHTADESVSHEVQSMMPIDTPSRGNFQQQIEQTRSNERHHHRTTTTSTEAPNYPPAFLKRFREREKTEHTSKGRHRNKETPENWHPPVNVNYSTSSLRVRHHDKHESHEKLHLEATSNKNEKWPNESGGTYVTIAPSAVAFALAPSLSTDDKLLNNGDYNLQKRKPVRLKMPHSASLTNHDYNTQNIRHRGSIKFGDKINFEEI